VKELGIEPGVDTLGRWMAHYLAELLERAETAPDEERNKARQDCADLILKLWSHRASLSMNRRPLQSFDSILAAINQLRGPEPIYFRDFRKPDDKEPSNDVEKWLDIAIRVDGIARDLVRACTDIAISAASKEEEEWLRTGLDLSTHIDMNAKIIIQLIKQFKEEQKEAPELLAMRRFREFAQICFEIAEGLRSFVTT
jgi:hypothetical protein